MGDEFISFLISLLDMGIIKSFRVTKSEIRVTFVYIKK